MSGDVTVFVTSSEDETAAVAASLAASLPPGSVVLLSGDLGAGKTAFVRGMASGLGIDPQEVSSPTFTLVQEYRGGRLTLYHVDLYRIETGEADDLGLDELARAGGVIAVEWAEKLARPVFEATQVEILDRGDDCREIRITASAPLRPES